MPAPCPKPAGKQDIQIAQYWGSNCFTSGPRSKVPSQDSACGLAHLKLVSGGLETKPGSPLGSLQKLRKIGWKKRFQALKQVQERFPNASWWNINQGVLWPVSQHEKYGIADATAFGIDVKVRSSKVLPLASSKLPLIYEETACHHKETFNDDGLEASIGTRGGDCVGEHTSNIVPPNGPTVQTFLENPGTSALSSILGDGFNTKLFGPLDPSEAYPMLAVGAGFSGISASTRQYCQPTQ
ncbi:hypothetical protein B0H13DRAFT_1878531 [Mycena leptocephala]|nr:hypothetical protein B0H13DRAFT_1878531 [Mycena leptocephala]